MAGIRADIDLTVNTQGVKRSLDKATSEINKVVGKISGKPIGFNVNEKSFTQPLGRINSSANEFTKSLEASNARVIAFGASVAILDGISNSFKGLVREAVKFEKTLADINVVLNLSNAQLRQFGEGLFDTARKTAQGFNMASEAALEFSRQGLSTEEVLRRTNDALILTRLTSLKAADAVAGLTAAVNAFGDAGLTTTDIIDKLAAVDVKFAVSSEDLINALQRAGAVAIDAGVEFDSLIGLVAALQQTTARGGAVIGNSLKTIFTRIQRPESLRQLEEMGIAIRDISGAVLPADRILLNMSKTFDRLTQAQQSNVVQFSAGIFQANVFRAALRDLAKEQSLQVQATEVSANAAGEAAMKNELLNKTISALASQAGTNIQELGAILGDLALGPQLADALEFVNKRVEEIRGALGGGEDEGSTFAKGLVRGIGNVISGPAAIAFGAIFIKLFMNIAKFASSSMKDVLGVVSQKDKIRQMEDAIVEVLSRNQHIQQSLNNLGGDRIAQEQFLLGIIDKQTAAMAEQRSLAASLAGPLVQKGVSPNITSSGGFIPEGSKKAERLGAVKGGYIPGAIDSMNIAGMGNVVYNKAETVKQFPGMKQPAIMPPQDSKAGSLYQKTFKEKHGFDPYASGGFVPNFANLVGSKLMMNKAKLSLFGGSMDIARATGANYQDVEKLFASGQPLKISASLKDIIMSSDSGKKTISGKETLFEAFNALSGAGVHSIERMFNVRPPVRGQRGKGKLTQSEFAERKTLNLLNKEVSGHQLTYDPKTKKGVQNYPVDIIGPGAHEVKSGKLSAANLISKSLRMASDRELSDWMSANKISGGKGLRGKNLKEAQRLAGKLGIKGSGQAGALTEADADTWSMSEGFVPSFANDWKAIYKEFVRRKDSIKSREDFKKIGLKAHRSIFPKINHTTRYNNQAKKILKEKYDEMWSYYHSLKNQSGPPVKYDYHKILNNLKNGVYKNTGDLQREIPRLTSTINTNSRDGTSVKKILGDKKYNEYVNLVKALPGGGGKRGGKGMPVQYIRGNAFEKLISEQAFDRPFIKGPQAIDIENIDPSYFNKRNKELFDIDGVYLHGDPIFTSNPKGHGAEGIFKKLANSIETKKQINNRIMDITSRPGRRPSTIDFGAFPFADMIGNSSRRGIKFVSESIRPVDISGRLPEMLRRIDPYTNMKFSYMRDYLKVPDKQRQILYGLKRGSKVPSSKELGEGLSYDGFVPNFRYWKKHVQFAKGADGSWGIKGDTSHLHGFIEYLQTSGKYSAIEIDKLKSKLKTVTDKRYKETKALGRPSMGREGAKYYANRHALWERPEILSLKGVFLKDLKGAIHGYNDQNNMFSSGLVPNFANIVPFNNTVPFKKKTIQSKNLMHQEYLKAYAEGQDKFKSGQTMLQFLSQFYDRKTLQDLRKYPEDYRILSGGFVPNFANPLKDAIEREKAAGIPASNIRVEQSNQLKGPGNPMGLAVTNTRDEPAGVGQGIRRAKSMGLDPKSHGAAGGFMPNFATAEEYAKIDKEQAQAAKGINKATEERIETEKKATRITRQRADADVMGLQKLFFLQSGISMANGMLQELGEEAGGTMKKFSELSMGATNLLSTFIAVKEFSTMLAGSKGVGSKMFGGGGSKASTTRAIIGRGLTRASAGGKNRDLGMLMRGLGIAGKGLLRFVPVIGQATMGLTLLHEGLKALGFNVFDLLKDNSDRAADKLEKLSESAEKTQSALDEANNLSATRDKMSKLEILGSQRTLKQEKELISLKIKEIKQQTSLQSKISKVDTAHLKNKDLIDEVNKVKSGEIKSTEALVRVLEKIAKQEAVQAAFATAIKDFSKKTEDEFGMFKSDAPSDLLKNQITQLANNIAEVTVGLAPERKQAMKESLAAGNIQGIAGLESLDLETAEKKQFFINALQKQIEVSEREFEDDKKIQQAKAGALNEYVKIVANYKKQTEQIAHQNNLDNIISASKRKINSSLLDLQSEYQMISKSTAIQNKTALEAAAITQKLESDKLKANNEALNGLETLRKEYMNIGKIASRFNSDAKDAQAGVAEFKQAIATGLSPQKISEVGDILGQQTPQQIQEINSFFAELGKEIKDLNDNQEIVNKLTKKYGDTQDATLRQAVMLLMHKMELTNIEQDHIELVKKINDTLRRSNETSEATAKAARDGLENETALNFIKQKTVEGARKLAEFMSKQGDPAEAILRNLQGEADTLAVINNFQKNRIQTLISSGDLDQKAYEEQVAKNRTDAEAALLSLKQLQVQENILRDTDEFKTIQIAKMQSEVLGASAAAKDAAFRNEYLSYNQTRESLVQSQISEETTTLETTARNNLTKLKLLAGSEQLKKQVDLQIQEEITSAQQSALINSEKALILSAMGKQGLLLQKANELQESSNKLTELQNAIRKAAVSKEELALSVGTNLAIEKAGAIRGTREAGMRATMTGSPEDALAFAQSLKETNQLLGEGSRAFDTLRVKLAEMDVAAKNLGSDLVNIGLDQTRSGMKQLFKDIGSGAKSAKEAWSDFGLGLADVLLDRMMEHNIDQIIKNLTFAFTGENALSEAEKIAGSNNHLIDANNKLVTSLDALAAQVEAQKRVLENDISSRSNIASQQGSAPQLNLRGVNQGRGAMLTRQANYQPPADPGIEKIQNAVKATKETQLRAAQETAIEAHKNAILQSSLREQEERMNAAKSRKSQQMKKALKAAENYPGMTEFLTDETPVNNFTPPEVAALGGGEPGVDKAAIGVAQSLNAASLSAENVGKAATGVAQGLNAASLSAEKLTFAFPVVDQHATVLAQSLNAASLSAEKLTYALESIPTNTPTEPGNCCIPQHFFGGKIQKFAKGGFVEGEPGVDKVPAMLTAGEFVLPKKVVKKLKDGGMLNYFKEGGVADRVKAGTQAVAQTITMNEVARHIADSIKEEKPSRPPSFDMNKFSQLSLGSTVSLGRTDPRLSAKFLAKDPVMEEYKGHLMDVAAYRVAQQNKDVDERISRVGQIVSTVTSFAISQLTSLAAEPLNAAFEKGKDIALGASGIGKHSGAYKAAREQGLDLSYSDIADSIESGKPINIDNQKYLPEFYNNKSGSIRSSKNWNWTKLDNTTESNNPNYGKSLQSKINKDSANFHRIDRQQYDLLRNPLKRNMGGSIPSMLTAGEGFVPAPIAKRIGYDNLNRMNKTGSMPIIEGPGGVDNVGPVGLSEGDFIIRKSSTNKLLKENPNMMRFAIQNPDGFRRAQKGYYEGGIVGTAASSAPSITRNTSGGAPQSSPAPQASTINSLLESTQPNQQQSVSNNQKTDVTNNINVNVTIDKSGNEKVSTEGAQGSYEQEKELAMKIKSKVLEVIREEKRIGGELG
jgi:TP901 family phage tail tape measure protein